MLDELWDDYLQYLIWRCGLEQEKKLSNIFAILHNIEFTWTIDRDDNREDDGVELRNDYEIPDGYTVEEEEAFMAHWCSVMEMLVALSIRVDYDYLGTTIEEHPEEFFLEMIHNLGLTKLVRRRYKESEVVKIVEKWLRREFDQNGKGSPFPLKHAMRDQRKIEIWDQMNAYISENYC